MLWGDYGLLLQTFIMTIFGKLKGDLKIHIEKKFTFVLFGAFQKIS